MIEVLFTLAAALATVPPADVVQRCRADQDCPEVAELLEVLLTDEGDGAAKELGQIAVPRIVIPLVYRALYGPPERQGAVLRALVEAAREPSVVAALEECGARSPDPKYASVCQWTLGVRAGTVPPPLAEASAAAELPPLEPRFFIGTLRGGLGPLFSGSAALDFRVVRAFYLGIDGGFGISAAPLLGHPWVGVKGTYRFPLGHRFRLAPSLGLRYLPAEEGLDGNGDEAEEPHPVAVHMGLGFHWDFETLVIGFDLMADVIPLKALDTGECWRCKGVTAVGGVGFVIGFGH